MDFRKRKVENIGNTKVDPFGTYVFDYFWLCKIFSGRFWTRFQSRDSVVGWDDDEVCEWDDWMKMYRIRCFW